jgi:hypothetical protein
MLTAPGYCADLGAASLLSLAPGVVSDFLLAAPLCLLVLCSPPPVLAPLLSDEAECAGDLPELAPMAPPCDEPDESLPPVDAGPDDLSPAPFGVPVPVAPGDMTSALEEPACAGAADAPPAPSACASASEDADATNINDKDRMVDFKVMSGS